MNELVNALKYPWNKRYWNWLWILMPFLGFFALYGYYVKIIHEVMKGNKEMPKFDSFWQNTLIGFWFTLMIIVWYVGEYILERLTFLAFSMNLVLAYVMELLVSLFVLLYMVGAIISFAKHFDFIEGFNLRKAWEYSFGHLREFIRYLINVCAIAIVYGFVFMMFVMLVFGNAIFSSLSGMFFMTGDLILNPMSHSKSIGSIFSPVLSSTAFSLIIYIIGLLFLLSYAEYSMNYLIGRLGVDVVDEEKYIRHHKD